MRIVYLTNHIGPTGVNQVVKDLVTVMMEHGHECHVFYLKDVKSHMTFKCPVSKLVRWSNLDGYDVIHAHGLRPELYMLRNGWHQWRNRCGERIKLITTLHCYCFQDFFDLYGKGKGLALGVLYLLSKIPFDKVVCLSKDMMNYYRRYVPKRKMVYAYNTRIIDEEQDLSMEEKDEILRFKGNSTLVGMNCVMLYRKGIDVMLQALALLPSFYKLFVVGDGQEKETFIEMARKLGQADRVYFAGKRNDAYRYLPYYDIYALPSRSEGFPISLLEAAAMGRRVVASRLPIVEECFSDEEVAKFDMSDAEAMADIILKIEDDTRLGERLKEQFEKSYSPSRFYQAYLSIYNS